MLLAGGLAKGSFMETLLFLWQPTNKVHWQSTKSTKDLRLSQTRRRSVSMSRGTFGDRKLKISTHSQLNERRESEREGVRGACVACQRFALKRTQGPITFTLI